MMPAPELLLSMLDGSEWASAVRPNGKPCRVRLPDAPDARMALVEAHVRGAPMTLTFHADGYQPWNERVEAVALIAYCPGSDGSCRWLGIDLDATDHGAKGLADPVHAARCIAERADAAGLLSGLLVARSRGGRGRHVFLLLPNSVALPDAVVGVAALVASAFKVAASDVAECGTAQAFRRANGAIARPGDAGAVELVPRSTSKPGYGWALALPCAGAFAAHGGGVIVDPFEDKPMALERIPRCDPEAWSTSISEARAALSKRRAAAAPPPANRSPHWKHKLDLLDRIDARTRTFLAGHAAEGTRNQSAFAASANLLGWGVDERAAERLILAGAAACGLAEREARAAFKSAMNATTRKARRA
ncbi:MAG: hypothetical protein IT449_05325 [Phycisphaerales bacterium]|nr:hypothetical protein [Phycisphaerales bacterium]